eukprot:g2732.t1
MRSSSLFGLGLNFASECVHFRYFVTHSEVTGCTIQHCGIEAFEMGKGSKVGEGIYVGTALDQVDDGKAPEPKIRSGSADNVDADNCAYNWIHHNTFRTYGNECVEMKEGSENNLVEHNVCEQQKDPNSGCFGSRGSKNTFRWNEIAECYGAGVRVGGDKGHGEGNNIYGNVIKNTGNGAFSVMSPNQGTVCENQISGVDAISFGSDDQDQEQFSEGVATGDCSDYPGDMDNASPSPAPESEEEEEEEEEDALTEDDDIEAGVNFADGADDEPEVSTVETNESAGSDGLGQCGTVLAVDKTSVQHPDKADSTTSINNLFDGDLDTYFSVNRESTYITMELSEEVEVNGIAIGFFMKDAAEERIQTFDVLVRAVDDDDWTTVISRKESSGEMDVQTFPFSSRMALYVRLETHGNDFNNWSAFTEIEVCAEAGGESNALFGGLQAAIGEELEVLAGQVCSAPTVLSPKHVHGSGSDDVRLLFDGNFETRWSTSNTQHESDLNNDKVVLTFIGDVRVSHLDISFFDGQHAHQYFSVYVQSARDYTWTPVLIKEQAAKTESLQTFEINMDGVNKLYIVGNGNDVGDFSKFSEVMVFGC